MFELLRSLKEYTEELEKKAERMRSIHLSSGKVLAWPEFSGAELIHEVGQFFLVFFTVVEIKGLKNSKAPTVVAFLEVAHKTREKIAKIFKEKEEKKEKEIQNLNSLEEKIEAIRLAWEEFGTVVEFYFLISRIFKVWNDYPFGSLKFTELKR